MALVQAWWAAVGLKEQERSWAKVEGGEEQPKSRHTEFGLQRVGLLRALEHASHAHPMEGSIDPNWGRVSLRDRGPTKPDVRTGTGSPIV